MEGIRGTGFTFKRLFSKRVQIDICDKCIGKLYIVTKDVYTRDKVLENTDYHKYDNKNLNSAYLQGVDDTLKLLNDYKIKEKNRKGW